jgi:outer membrane protein assembly factor BamB
VRRVAGDFSGGARATLAAAYQLTAGFSSDTAPQVLWSFAGDGHLATTPIVVNNYVFIGSTSGNLYAVDATSGQQVWTQNLGAAIPANAEYNGTYTSLAAGDGLLLVPNGTKLTAFVLSTNP